jgi:Rieske 2Fe-2S family protein
MDADNRSIEELIADHRPGYALEQRFYTDPAIYELELERIIMRNWIMVAHESEFAEIGDFKTVQIAHESAIIVRGSDGDIKAFANVCRHRGSLVCLESSGNTRKFTCPYHGWMYDIDGNLTAARSMADGFDKSEYGLKTVSVDVLGGLIFICFSDKPASLENARQELAEPMAMFDFDNLKLAAHRSYDIDANWKLSIENYAECYHCATAHPEYAQMHTLMIDGKMRDRVQGHMYDKMTSCGLRDIWIEKEDCNVPAGEFGYAYSRTALFEGYLTGSKEGKPVAPLLGELTDYDGGASDFNLGPFSYLLAYSDHVVCYVFTPVDLNNSKCDIYWLVRADAEEGKDYDVDELVWLWDITTEADKTIIVNNSKGVHSRFYKPGPFSEMEDLERSFIEWVLRELQHD